MFHISVYIICTFKLGFQKELSTLGTKSYWKTDFSVNILSMSREKVAILLNVM